MTLKGYKEVGGLEFETSLSPIRISSVLEWLGLLDFAAKREPHSAYIPSHRKAKRAAVFPWSNTLVCIYVVYEAHWLVTRSRGWSLRKL